MRETFAAAAAGFLDAGPLDGGAPVTIAVGALPADATYRRSAYVQGIPPTSNMCISPPLYVPFQGTGDPGTCCYVAQQRTYANAARIVLKAGRRVCLESGAASTCDVLDARAPGVASATLTDNTALTAVFKAWGMVMFGSSAPALTLDRSSVTVTPSADGASAKAVFKVQTGWESGPGCKRGEGSWMHETLDVPLAQAP